MNRRELLTSVAAVGLAGAAGPVRPPMTEKRPFRIEQLGRTRIDDYAWLKPANWKSVWRDPARLAGNIRRHLEAENTWCDAVLEPTLPLQSSLAAEIRALGHQVETPARIVGEWAYQTRTLRSATHPSWFRRPVAGGPETLLLDGEARAAGHVFLRIINAGPSPDGRLFAWAEDDTGAEKYRIFIKVIATGEIIAGPTDAFGDFRHHAGRPAWLVWTWRSPESRPARCSDGR